MRAFAKSQRGRPKRLAANENDRDPALREPALRDPALRDLGTAELQMKRAQLARGLDPATSAHPLDLLHAKGWLSAAQQRAGFQYAALYRQAIGRTDVSYGRFYDGVAGTGGAGQDSRTALASEHDLTRLEQRFRTAKRHLLQAGPQVVLVTERIAVFGVWPNWVLAGDGQEARDWQRLRAGLTALVTSFAAPHP